jgi:hypothetical protein
MKKSHLGLYTDYLASAFGQKTAYSKLFKLKPQL